MTKNIVQMMMKAKKRMRSTTMNEMPTLAAHMYRISRHVFVTSFIMFYKQKIFNDSKTNWNFKINSLQRTLFFFVDYVSKFWWHLPWVSIKFI